MAQKAKLPTAYLLVSAFSLVLMGWLYGGDIADTISARTAEVAAFSQPPSMLFAVVVLIAAGGGALVTVFGALKGKTGGWRGYRVMPIVTVVVLFVDLFLLTHSSTTSAERAQLALNVLSNQANMIATPESVPKLAELQSLVDAYEPPAYLVKGERPKGWTLQERRGCTGPVNDAKGAPVGTIFYCVGVDNKEAWLSLVALDDDQRFGAGQVMKRAGQVVFRRVVASRPDDGSDDDMEPPPVPFPQVNPGGADSGF